MGSVEICVALGAARKAVHLYPPEHPTHREALQALVQAVNEAVDVRPLVLNLRSGRLYEASEVITDASPAIRSVANALELRRVESLTFHMGFTAQDGEGIADVLGLKPSPELQVQAELDARGVRGVTVSELEDNSSKEAEERDRRREADRALYRATLSALRDITAGLVEGTKEDANEAVRALAVLIERVTEAPDAILSLATMTGHGERSRFHAAGVMLYSLVLGQRLGLSDRQMVLLGVAALFHDIAMTLPSDTDAETRYAAHPIAGAQTLGAITDEDCLSVITTFEHHMGVDGSGWPARAPEYVTHPLSGIVAIANRYDNLTRPESGEPWRPDQAAAQLLREASGGPLDPILTRVFVQALGVFPVATMVRLSDHSIAIVRTSSEDPLQPQVRVVVGSDGAELRPAPDVDLAEDGRFIVGAIPAALMEMHPADYL